ncbi:MAG: GNAT family N-acetyltransferase [Anaerolinea sp.]|nr:GNAT family N-acetyltransferase [Anaerolinea sp.]
MDIRPLVPDDAESYVAIWRRALTEEPTAYGASAEDPDMFALEPARQRIAHTMPYNPIFGVFIDGQQVGLSSVFYQENRAKVRHRAQIHQVYVAPEMRGRGVGKAMMEQVIAFVRTIPDVEELHLSVTVGNEAARRLYIGLGFVPYGIDPRVLKFGGAYYDLERMALMLHPPENITHG